jgi:hypothetical protein
MSEPWAESEPSPDASEAWRAMLARVNAAEEDDRRRERLASAREGRERAEAQERAEDRRVLWASARRAEFRRAGRPFDPGDDRTLMLTEDEILQRGFAMQDHAAAEARRAARKLLEEHGLLDAVDWPHRLDAVERVQPAEGVSRTSPSAGSGGVSRSRFPKVTEFLHRGGATPCMCSVCVGARARRIENAR